MVKKINNLACLRMGNEVYGKDGSKKDFSVNRIEK